VVINVFFVLADLDFKFYGFGFQVSGVRCQVSALDTAKPPLHMKLRLKRTAEYRISIFALSKFLFRFDGTPAAGGGAEHWHL